MKKNNLIIDALNRTAPHYNTINELIKEQRYVNGYEPEEVCGHLGISPKTYLEYEKDGTTIPIDIMSVLIKLFHLPKNTIKFAVDTRLPIYSQRLAALRIREKRTLEETSQLIQVALTTYAGYERGRREPDLKTLIKLANLYNVSLDYLTGRY